MNIPILVEPIAIDRFRARAGEPFGATAEGATPAEAAHLLEALLQQRLCNGTTATTIKLDGADRPMHFEPLPDDDWFFQTMREAIADNRAKELDDQQ